MPGCNLLARLIVQICSAAVSNDTNKFEEQDSARARLSYGDD